MDRLADIDRIGAHLDRETNFRNQISRFDPNDAAADDTLRLGVE